MTLNADNDGVNSTSLNDSRITPMGHKIRKYKIDEFTQLWNELWSHRNNKQYQVEFENSKIDSIIHCAAVQKNPQKNLSNISNETEENACPK